MERSLSKKSFDPFVTSLMNKAKELMNWREHISRDDELEDAVVAAARTSIQVFYAIPLDVVGSASSNFTSIVQIGS